MEQIGQIISQQKLSERKPLSTAPQSQAVMLTSTERQEVATIIFQCFQTLKLYGKEAESLESLTSMFQLVLAEYPIDKIRQAFGYFLKHYTEMPTPADIANIIDRGNKPPFDRSVYVSLSKKPAEDRTSAEWAYMRDYEQFQIEG